MAKKDNTTDDIPHEREGARPDYSVQPTRKKLPKDLQDTLDNEEKLWAALYEGTAGESTDSDVRYAAYASRVRTILRSAQRYVAYTSDIGESFRPVAHPWLVRGAYAVSWVYLAGDVSHEGYKAYLRNQRVLHPELHLSGAAKEKEGPGTGAGVVDNLKKVVGMKGEQGPVGADGTTTATTMSGVLVPGRVPALEDYRAVMAQRAVFQSVASMGLPALTIHSVVKYTGKALKDAKNKNIRTYAPIGLGLAVVPFLPFIYDEPVEKAVEWIFHKGFTAWGGPEAVGITPTTGQKEMRYAESKAGAAKEREL